MRLAFAFALAALACMFALPKAEAQNVRIYKWCLVEAGRGGWGSTLCRFDTIEQCRMSMNGPWDRCVPNTGGQRP